LVNHHVSSNEIVAIEPIQDKDKSEEESSLAGAMPMSGELIDLKLPAHDPSFPKPRGLLPVPREIEEAVAREDERLLRDHGIVVAPEARQRMLNNSTLQYYYESAYVASRHTALGVEILAVGRDEARKFIQNVICTRIWVEGHQASDFRRRERRAAGKFWLPGEKARKAQRPRAYCGGARGRRGKGLAWPGHVAPKIGAIDKSRRSLAGQPYQRASDADRDRPLETKRRRLQTSPRSHRRPPQQVEPTLLSPAL
jgi:hypothetical protein